MSELTSACLKHTYVWPLCLINMRLSSQLSYRCSKSNAWYTSTVHVFTSCNRRAKSFWKRTRSALVWSSLASRQNRYHELFPASKNSIMLILYPPALTISVLSGKLLHHQVILTSTFLHRSRFTCWQPCLLLHWQTGPDLPWRRPCAASWWLSLIHIWRCRRIERCRSRWSPYH